MAKKIQCNQTETLDIIRSARDLHNSRHPEALENLLRLAGELSERDVIDKVGPDPAAAENESQVARSAMAKDASKRRGGKKKQEEPESKKGIDGSGLKS